ncbi:MAG TPA: hypothetical protein VFA33_17990 [Bryobacteraceae bacterium]|nr:hypothetical protein [Bryobacteraceae bacterium]
MMVAAHPGDLKAAGACGLRTAYVPRPREYGRGGAEPAAAESFHVAARDFLDLAARLL